MANLFGTLSSNGFRHAAAVVRAVSLTHGERRLMKGLVVMVGDQGLIDMIEETPTP